jgi:hypothetical protein
MVTHVETHSELLLAARTAHGRRDWHASYEAFTRAGQDTPLGTDDLDAMSTAAWRLGRGKESLRVAERVFAQLARTDPPSAAMKAVDLALAWVTRGDLNIGQGWMNRARVCSTARRKGRPTFILPTSTRSLRRSPETRKRWRNRRGCFEDACRLGRGHGALSWPRRSPRSARPA